MTDYFRSPRVVITHKLVRVRVSGGWRVFVLSEMDGWGVVHAGLPPATGMWALGSSAILVGLLAFQLAGWVVPFALVIFGVALVVAYWERRRARDRSCSQLWASYRGGPDVVVFELPRSEFERAIRGLIKSLEHGREFR